MHLLKKRVLPKVVLKHAITWLIRNLLMNLELLGSPHLSSLYRLAKKYNNVIHWKFKWWSVAFSAFSFCIWMMLICRYISLVSLCQKLFVIELEILRNQSDVSIILSIYKNLVSEVCIILAQSKLLPCPHYCVWLCRTFMLFITWGLMKYLKW